MGGVGDDLIVDDGRLCWQAHPQLNRPTGTCWQSELAGRLVERNRELDRQKASHGVIGDGALRRGLWRRGHLELSGESVCDLGVHTALSQAGAGGDQCVLKLLTRSDA